jgi:hypothetical protein
MEDAKHAEAAPAATDGWRRLTAAQLAAVVEAAYILDAVER